MKRKGVAFKVIVKRKKSEKGAEEEEKFGNGVKSVQKLDVQ